MGDIARVGEVRETDRIRRLELEVAQLKGLLAKQVSGSLDGSTVNDHSPPQHRPDNDEAEVEATPPPPIFAPTQDPFADNEELRFFRGKEFKTRYFGPRSAFLAFKEVRISRLLLRVCPDHDVWVAWRPVWVHEGDVRGVAASTSYPA